MKREQRKQLLVETQLRAESKAVQKLLSMGFSLKRIPIQAPAIQFSREPDFELFVSGNVSTLRGTVEHQYSEHRRDWRFGSL